MTQTKKQQSKIVLSEILSAFVADMNKRDISYTIEECKSGGKSSVTVTTYKYKLISQPGSLNVKVTDKIAKISKVVNSIEEMKAFCY